MRLHAVLPAVLVDYSLYFIIIISLAVLYSRLLSVLKENTPL